MMHEPTSHGTRKGLIHFIFFLSVTAILPIPEISFQDILAISKRFMIEQGGRGEEGIVRKKD